jgi:transcriptional regulator with XRE-family HTH domain
MGSSIGLLPKKGAIILDLRLAVANEAGLAVAVPGASLFRGTVDTQPARPRRLPNIFDTWVGLPEAQPTALPESQRLTQEILAWTGWSQRKLARALGATHPTIRALEEGRSAARARDLFDRLVEVHSVVERIFLVAHRDESETDRLLSTAPGDGLAPAIVLIEERRPAEAYLAAMDVHRPRRQSAMMSGIWPAKAGEATTALEDAVDSA